MNKKIRIIKKYPNRRLYDTEISKYVTLDDIKQLVLSHTDFQVIDKQTETDITGSILLQIISELESQQMPIFTNTILLNIIRYYGNPMQTAFSQFLEKSMSLFTNSQANFQQQMEGADNTNPHDAMANLAKQNLAAWQSLLEQFFVKPNSNKS